MTYVDVFVAAVPDANQEKYAQVAKWSSAIFRECGAVRVVECWGDEVPDGETTSFRKAVKAEEGESVVVSLILWESKASRDRGMEQAMARMETEGMDMPFDGKRLIYGGFSSILDV